MNRDDIYMVLEKYDHQLFDYYYKNAAYLSVGAGRYAEKLLQDRDKTIEQIKTELEKVEE